MKKGNPLFLPLFDVWENILNSQPIRMNALQDDGLYTYVIFLFCKSRTKVTFTDNMHEPNITTFLHSTYKEKFTVLGRLIECFKYVNVS